MLRSLACSALGSIFLFAGHHSAQHCEWEKDGLLPNPCEGLWTSSAVGIGVDHWSDEGLLVRSEWIPAIQGFVRRPGSKEFAHGTAINGWVEGGWENFHDDSFGVRGWIEGFRGAGVCGVSVAESEQAPGVLGVNFAADSLGVGVRGTTESPIGRGVEGLADSLGGGQKFGVYGRAKGNDGIGVGGFATGSGLCTGVSGTSEGSLGFGVYGYAASDWGTTTGVRGHAVSPTGAGVHGSSLGTGVLGHGTGGGTGVTSIGVHGKGEGKGAWAGYFEGNAYFRDHLSIGVPSQQFTLHVNGTAGKPGGGSWSVASDARLKRDVQPLEGSLQDLLSLRGVSFEYTDPEAIHELGGRRIGLIAQEVEAVFPDWVEEGNDGYRRVTYRGFEALVVEALRELRAEQSAEVEALRREVATLKERLEVADAGPERASVPASAARSAGTPPRLGVGE